MLKIKKTAHFFLRTSKYMGEGSEFDDVQRKEHVGSSCVFCQILVYLFYRTDTELSLQVIQTILDLDVLRKDPEAGAGIRKSGYLVKNICYACKSL